MKGVIVGVRKLGMEKKEVKSWFPLHSPNTPSSLFQLARRAFHTVSKFWQWVCQFCQEAHMHRMTVAVWRSW